MSRKSGCSANCDFQMVADLLTALFEMAELKAQRRGGHIFHPIEFMARLNYFWETPSEDTATILLQAAPVFHPIFEACSPGGLLYEQKSRLRS